MTSLEVTTSSSDVADEENFFFTHADNEIESKEQTYQRKQQSRQDAKEGAANEESSSMSTFVEKIKKIDGNTMSYSIDGVKAIAQLRVEQDINLTLNNLKVRTLSQLFDEVLMTTDWRYKHYKAKIREN